jgi:hypothetical protein
VGFVSFHKQCLDSTGPFSGRDGFNVCYLRKAGNRKDIGADKGRIKGCKSGREDNRVFHTLCTPVRASLATSRNDSGMPKHQYGVADQLARRAPKKAEIVSHFAAGAGDVDETIKADFGGYPSATQIPIIL